jgi:hypothetical protein
VNLDDASVLAQNGLAPSEGNPQFHQQMVYAAVMTTVDRFERALGRKAFWADRYGKPGERYVQRLRIYPHALRMANAYYLAIAKNPLRPFIIWARKSQSSRPRPAL